MKTPRQVKKGRQLQQIVGKQNRRRAIFKPMIDVVAETKADVQPDRGCDCGKGETQGEGKTQPKMHNQDSD